MSFAFCRSCQSDKLVSDITFEQSFAFYILEVRAIRFFSFLCYIKNMEIIKANILGYCMGVRSAIDKALAEVKLPHQDKKVFTMGPLIHNPRVIEQLKTQGIDILDDEDLSETEEHSLEGAVVIIRAHGISPQLEETLKEKHAEIIDATCPRVKANQLKARKFSDDAYTVFLAGEKHHGEIIGLKGYCPDCLVVENADEAAAEAEILCKKNPAAQCVLIGQTTISREEYDAIAKEIQRHFPHLLIVDAICNATKDRQEALRELCVQTYAVIIAGSKTSANTKRLLKIAQDMGKPAWLVEGKGDLPPEIFQYEKVGISAGASTPEEVIREIEEALR
jgi:4-hydroxy-3-methylbut-2-enyl diphosphate reductase